MSQAVTVAPPSLQDLEQFLFREALLLDKRLWEDWLQLFTNDGYYWVPLVPEQQDAKNHVSLYYEDAMLRQMRVRRLRQPRAFSGLQVGAHGAPRARPLATASAADS